MLTVAMIRKAVAKLEAAPKLDFYSAPIRNWHLFFKLQSFGCIGRLSDGSYFYDDKPRTWLSGKPVGAP